MYEDQVNHRRVRQFMSSITIIEDEDQLMTMSKAVESLACMYHVINSDHDVITSLQQWARRKQSEERHIVVQIPHPDLLRHFLEDQDQQVRDLHNNSATWGRLQVIETTQNLKSRKYQRSRFTRREEKCLWRHCPNLVLALNISALLCIFTRWWRFRSNITARFEEDDGSFSRRTRTREEDEQVETAKQFRFYTSCFSYYHARFTGDDVITSSATMTSSTRFSVCSKLAAQWAKKISIVTTTASPWQRTHDQWRHRQRHWSFLAVVVPLHRFPGPANHRQTGSWQPLPWQQRVNIHPWKPSWVWRHHHYQRHSITKCCFRF